MVGAIFALSAALLVPNARAAKFKESEALRQLATEDGSVVELPAAAPTARVERVQYFMSYDLLSFGGFTNALIYVRLADKDVVNHNLAGYIARADKFIEAATKKGLSDAERKAQLQQITAKAHESLKLQAQKELLPDFLAAYADDLLAPIARHLDETAALVKAGDFASAAAKAKQVRAELRQVQLEVNAKK